MDGLRRKKQIKKKIRKVRKVNPNLKWQLIQIYLNLGMHAAKAECLAQGLNASYAANAATVMGFHRLRKDYLPTGRKGPRLVTEEKQWELIQIYLHLGTVISERECVEAGVCRQYASNSAKAMGLSRHDNIGRSHRSEMWERAIQKGKICT